MEPTKINKLFIITGASCIGKSSACEMLFKNEKDYIVMESDLLWSEVYNTPEDNYRSYRELWLRVCSNISQTKPTILLIDNSRISLNETASKIDELIKLNKIGI